MGDEGWEMRGEGFFEMEVFSGRGGWIDEIGSFFGWFRFSLRNRVDSARLDKCIDGGFNLWIGGRGVRRWVW